MATYLAERSLEGEKFLLQHYGEVLERSKGEVFATTRRISETTGLRVDMIERAAGQLHRTTFGSFDHLQGLVTSYNSGALGDYRIGSLRVEVQFEGSVRFAELRSEMDAHQVVTHELHHAASAQFESRCGLQAANGQGLEINEGMTEYLAQLSTGSPGIVVSVGGESRVRPNVPYGVPVLAMLALHKQFEFGKNSHFAILFNAYHGDSRNKSKLENALDAFYRLDVEIARRSR